ncbi:unnamed protein product [Arctogadus glacialis]
MDAVVHPGRSEQVLLDWNPWPMSTEAGCTVNTMNTLCTVRLLCLTLLTPSPTPPPSPPHPDILAPFLLPPMSSPTPLTPCTSP